MPRVNRVDHARKSPGSCGKCQCTIATKEPYVWWKFRFGGKHLRCAKASCSPKASDLTQSDFWGTVYRAQENDFAGCESVEDLESLRDEVVGELQDLASECEDKLGNMPEGLQQGSTGELLQERADACNEAANELEGVDISFDEPDKDDGETEDEFEERKTEELAQRLEEISTEITDGLGNISCS